MSSNINLNAITMIIIIISISPNVGGVTYWTHRYDKERKTQRNADVLASKSSE